MSKHDLEFILKQIKIAEAHAAGGDLRKLVAEAGGLDPNAATTPTQAFLLPYGLRTVDGTYNNLVEGRETWGAADQPFPEHERAPVRERGRRHDDVRHARQSGVADNNNYTPGSATGSPMLTPGTVVDADPRTISNLIADQTLNNPAAISAALTYAGITGAAQMTAISQIQAARAAIAQAVQTSNTTSGGIPALVTAKAEAQTAATTASNEATNAQAAADAAQAALATANGEKAAAQLVVTQTFNAFNALLTDGIPTDQQQAEYDAALNAFVSAQETLNAKTATADALVTPAQNAATAAQTAATHAADAAAALETATQALAQAQTQAQSASAAVTTAETALSNSPDPVGHPDGRQHRPDPERLARHRRLRALQRLFTLFGQFFDHGLDLVSKGGNGTVYIPLSPDDPLYNPATPHTNFMVMTRATRDGDGDTINTTTPWVDQNQTYTSHASHQVFLREYMTGPDGKPIATGQLLEGARGLATWADVKAQAQDDARHRADRRQCRQHSAAAHRPLRQVHPAIRETGYAAGSSSASAPTARPNTADDIVLSGTPAEPGRGLANARPHRPRLPRRHRPCGRARRRRAASSRPTATAPSATRMPTARRPASSTRADRTLPTTTSCSTRTTSPATAAATRTSA